ncbi:DUF6152 family protein [Arenicella sp.]|nr:DUF6152 family protein [Arenicella sp.]
MKVVSSLFLTLALSVIATSSQAHHGSNGQFDTSKEIEISGVITDVKFVNPHSYFYFDETADDGTVNGWRCELRAGSLLKRNGWTDDLFAAGTKVTVTAAPARREEFGCMTQTIAYEDGRVVSRYDVLNDADSLIPKDVAATRADGTPNFAGNWAAEQRVPGGTGGMGAPGEMGAMGPGGPPSYNQTEAGKLASAGFNSEDNPRFHCKATNIFLDWWFDQHVNTIEETDDTIVMRYGFMDIVRTIHVGMQEHPDDITPSRAGHSIGNWDGDTLVVDTVGFLEGYLDGRFGIKHSDELHTVERFSLSDDLETLTIDYTLEDPKYLVGTFEGSQDVKRTTAAFDPYNCDDLTEERVKGF